MKCNGCSTVIQHCGHCLTYGFNGQNFIINSEVDESIFDLWQSINLPGLSGTVIVTADLIAPGVTMQLIINGDIIIPLTQGETYSVSVSPLQSVQISTEGAVGVNEVTASVEAVRIV